MAERSGVFSDREIREAQDAGRIIIDPFDPNHVKGSSYDVSLGGFYYRTESTSHGNFYNPFDPASVKKYFGKVQVATTHEEYVETNGLQPFVNIPLDHPIIVLGPGERILGHTHEFIGIRGEEGTTMMKARSTWGRNGISVCHDAGWGDPGYVNRWTMEIINLNQQSPVPLPVGERVGQIVFFHTGIVDSPYLGKYQTADQELSPVELLGAVKSAWSPEQMLPGAHKDHRPAVKEILGLTIDEPFVNKGDK